MKKIFVTLFAAMAMAFGASAQYMPTEQGRTFSFSDTDKEENTTSTIKSTVLTVETGADGILTARVEDKEPVPGSAFGEVTTYTGYSFNPADTVTTVTIMTADDFKQLMITSIREMASAAGQFISDDQLAQMSEVMKVKGEITIPLNPNAATDTKFANSTINCRVEGQSMDVRLTKGVYGGMETIETPAGSFDCIKVSYQIRFVGMGLVPEQRVTAWYAPGIGLVREINTDKKGVIKNERILQ